jgi:hypothetical protein
MAEAFRRSCPAPIVSLRRSAGDELVDGAEYHIDPDPETMLNLINKIAKARSAEKLQVSESDRANASAER